MQRTLSLLRAAASALGLATTVAGATGMPPPPEPVIVAPGLPGRVDVSRLPLPQVVVQFPTIIIRPTSAPPPPPPPAPGPTSSGGVVVVIAPSVPVPPPPRAAPPQQPVYMWVPPGHRKNWAKHCHKYQACSVPVLFVRDEWYDKHVHKGAKHRDDDDGKPGKGHGKGEGPGKGNGKG